MEEKKKINKIQIIMISIGILVMLGFAGVSYWFNSNPTHSGGADRVLKYVEKVEANRKNDDGTAASYSIDEDVTKLFPDNIKEFEVQTALHQMSHQKVEADKKWGALLITEERIDRLYDVVKVNEIKFKHGQVYIRILERWKKGDFSQVDEDHNTIWKYQDGTVGKATGILSAKEEEKFIAEYFK